MPYQVEVYLASGESMAVERVVADRQGANEDAADLGHGQGALAPILLIGA